MEKLIFTCCASLALIWSAPSYSQTSGRNAIAEQKVLVAEASVLIEQWKNEENRKCDSEIIAQADIKVAQARGIEMGWYRIWMGEKVRILKDDAYQVVKIVTPIAIEAQLDLADAYLSANCNSIADSMYRKVISSYTGKAYDSYRQRAQIGIDDVRSKNVEKQ